MPVPVRSLFGVPVSSTRRSSSSYCVSTAMGPFYQAFSLPPMATIRRANRFAIACTVPVAE
ncbi:hypothetical protein Asi03nite_34590 [Actinoplanes siamensis]|uniref:Uncharacterized protein n=1 Tax=Actinoplanes siamensis TaxID=1223317 RepID=A0A919N7N9_9ACTN|nr:hypothetical protein Asi03nite_34590 [Actinoplanes siamensis]